MRINIMIHSVGINDNKYKISSIINDKTVMCKYYQAWRGILTRCYSDKYHKKYPTYTECTVTKEWLTFSKFKGWMITQDWEGKCLDKDILVVGNKEYHPDKCMFVTNEINNLFTNSKSSRGKYKTGVCFNKERQKFQAEIRKYGEKLYLGCYDTEREAHAIYRKTKYSYVLEVANKQTDPLKSALIRHAELIKV